MAMRGGRDRAGCIVGGSLSVAVKAFRFESDLSLVLVCTDGKNDFTRELKAILWC